MNYDVNLDAYLVKYAPTSKRDIKLALKNFIAYLDSINKNFESVDMDICKAYRDSLSSKRLSAQTIRNRLNWLSIIFDFLMAEKIVSANYFKLLTKPSELLHVGTESAVSALDMDKLLELSPLDFKLIILLSLRCMLTSSEIISIKTCNVTIQKEFSRIALIWRKKERYIIIPFDMKKLFDSYAYDRSTEYLFVNSYGKQLSLNVLERKFSQVCLNAGVQDITLKQIRATALIRATSSHDIDYVNKRTGLSYKVLNHYNIDANFVLDNADIHNLMYVDTASGQYDYFRIVNQLFVNLKGQKDLRVYTNYVDDKMLVCVYSQTQVACFFDNHFSIVDSSFDEATIINKLRS